MNFNICLHKRVNNLMSEDKRRVYVLTKRHKEKDFFIGCFTNRKILFEMLKKIGTEGCFIAGARKNKEVTQESISTGFVGRNLTIYINDDKTNERKEMYKILEIYLNEVNPFFQT